MTAAFVGYLAHWLILYVPMGFAVMVPGQLHAVADSNLAVPDHVTIQGERAAKFPHDVCEYLTVLFQAVWIKRRHDAAPTEILDPDDDLSDVKALPRPRALSLTFAPADYQIRSEAPASLAKCRDRSIRRHQQRQHVESIAGVIANEPGTRPHDVLNNCADLGIAPQHAANHRLA